MYVFSIYIYIYLQDFAGQKEIVRSLLRIQKHPFNSAKKRTNEHYLYFKNLRDHRKVHFSTLQYIQQPTIRYNTLRLHT